MQNDLFPPPQLSPAPGKTCVINLKGEAGRRAAAEAEARGELVYIGARTRIPTTPEARNV